MRILLILLALLKILAIILLILVLTIIVVVALLLLIPIKYNINAEKSIRLYANLEIKWFIKAIYFRYKISSNCKRVIFKIFGKTVYKNKKIFEDESQSEESKTEEKIKDKNVQDFSEAEIKHNEDIEVNKYINEEKEIQYKEEKVSRQAKDIIEDELEKVEDVAVEEIEEDSVIKKLINLWNYPDRKEIVSSLIKLTKRSLKILFPQKLNIDAEIGCDNPAVTGYVLALSSILVLYFGNNISVYGNFEKSVLNGEFQAEGKFSLFKIVWALLAFIITKPIRKIIWNYLRNRRKEE